MVSKNKLKKLLKINLKFVWEDWEPRKKMNTKKKSLRL